MDDAVNGGQGGHRIFEDALPFRKNQVCRDGHAAPFVAFGQQGKEHFHLISFVLDVPDIVEEDARVAVELGQSVRQAQVALGSQQLLHQGGSRRPQHGLALENQLVAQGGKQMAFADARFPHGHDVDRIGDERSATQVLHLLLDDQRETIELQRAERLVGR